MLRIIRRGWLPLLIAAVTAVGGFTVHRVHGFFAAHNEFGSSEVFADTEPFHPKIVVYEIFSPDGTFADINYLDLSAEPQRVDDVPLPWSLRLETTDPAVNPYIVAQGDGGVIGCRITVDDEIKAERTTQGVSAQTFCLVKAA